MADKSSETSMPWSLLAQYCAIGVEPYTVEVGRLLTQHFKLSIIGERNIVHALNNLGLYGRSDENLSFGFGMKHIIHNPTHNTTTFVLTASALHASATRLYPSSSAYFPHNALKIPIAPLLYPPPKIAQWFRWW